MYQKAAAPLLGMALIATISALNALAGATSDPLVSTAETPDTAVPAKKTDRLPSPEAANRPVATSRTDAVCRELPVRRQDQLSREHVVANLTRICR